MSKIVQGIKKHGFKHLPGARAMDAIATDKLRRENLTYDMLGTTDFPQATLFEDEQSSASRSISPKTTRQWTSSRYESTHDQEEEGERYM